LFQVPAIVGKAKAGMAHCDCCYRLNKYALFLYCQQDNSRILMVREFRLINCRDYFILGANMTNEFTVCRGSNACYPDISNLGLN